MNKIIELLEKSVQEDNPADIIYEKNEENNWIGKDIAYIRNTSLEYAKKINTGTFNKGDVVVIEHDNTIDDYCKLFAVWYAGGIPFTVYKKISQLAKDMLYGRIKTEYTDNMHYWEDIHDKSLPGNSLINNWQTHNANDIAFLSPRPIGPCILKFSHSALYNLTQSFVDNKELAAGDTYYLPSPIDELFVLFLGILTSLATKRKSYISKSIESHNYIFRRPDVYLNCIEAFKEINPAVIMFCDFFYYDIRDYCLQIKKQNPSITKKQLREEIFGKNLKHAFISVYNQAKLSTSLLDFFDNQLGIKLQYFLFKMETPLSFMNYKKEYVKGSIGKLASASSEYAIIDDELCIKTDSMFSGYVGKTDSNLTEQGFFKTNYLAHEDKDNFVFLNGKKRSPLLI